MFKRVERRRNRREEAEELGLDEDTREVLGLNDTDSDESDSSDDDQNENADDGTEEEVGEEEEDVEEDSDEGDEESDEDEPSLTILQTLEDPLFIVSIDPLAKICIICPGKLLKGTSMISTHVSSKAHIRRFQQFKKLSEGQDNSNDAREVLQLMKSLPGRSEPQASGLSKRAEKKRAHSQLLKTKRIKRREQSRIQKDGKKTENAPSALSLPDGAVSASKKRKAPSKSSPMTHGNKKKKRVEKA